MAESHAAEAMIKFIHNPAEKTRLEELMTTAAPFYFAQNQAWRRAGRLLAEDPGAFMQYAISMIGVTNWVGEMTQANNMPFFYFPTSLLSIGNIPFTGSLASLATMNPFAEGEDESGKFGLSSLLANSLTPKFGPVITFPAHLIMADLMNIGDTSPVSGDIKKFLLGPIGSHSNLWQYFVPNSVVRQMAVGISGGLSMLSPHGTGDPLHLGAGYQQAIIECLRSLVYEQSKKHYDELLKQGLRGENLDTEMAAWAAKTFDPKMNPQGYSKLVDMANTRAVTLWVTKMAIGITTPISGGIGTANQDMQDMYRNYLNKFGFPQGIDKFYKDHPYATIATIYKSKSTIGSYLPETKRSNEIVFENQGEVTKYPQAFLAFHDVSVHKAAKPQYTDEQNMLHAAASVMNNPRAALESTGFIKYVPKAEESIDKPYAPASTNFIAMGLRERNTPESFINNYLISLGNNWYYNDIKPKYDRLVEKYPNQKGALYRWRQAMVDWYGGSHNPTWLSAKQEQERGITQKVQITQLQDMLKEPKYRDSNEGKSIRAFMSSNYYKDLEMTKVLIQQGKMTWDARKQWWEDVCNYVEREDPNIKPAMAAIFRNLA